MSKRSWFVAGGIAAVLALSCACGVPVTGIVAWRAGWLPGDARNAAQRAAGIPPDGASWSELQAAFKKKGWPTSRLAGPGPDGMAGMWFGDGDGKPLHAESFLSMIEDGPGWAHVMDQGCVYARDCRSAAAAQAVVADIADRQQKKALAYGPFVLYGADWKLKELAKLLK